MIEALMDFGRWFLANQFTFSILMAAIVLLGPLINGCAVCILAERKLSGYIQDRKGPNRVGPWGLLQPLADGIKFILKEDYTPGHVDRPTFILAPAIAFITALLGFVIVPWAGEIHWPWMEPGQTVSTQAASLDVGFLYVLAVGSLAVYGVVLAGWSSNNKYAFYGGMRATAQMLSYEVPLGLALLAILLIGGSLRLEVLVAEQASTGLWWVAFQPIAFIMVLIASLAEANRAPFDLAECEQELIAGFHVEYGSMKFAMFPLGEYAHMMTSAAIMTAVFFGGWHVWGLTDPADTTLFGALLKFTVFWAKIAAFIGLFMLIRWTVPRFRYDQLMRVAWKSMVPMGLGLVIGNGLLVYMGWHKLLAANLAVNAAVFVLAVIVSAMAKAPVTGRQVYMPAVQVAPGGGRSAAPRA